MSDTTKTAVQTPETEEYKGRSLAQETWRRLLKNKGAIVGDRKSVV